MKFPLGKKFNGKDYFNIIHPITLISITKNQDLTLDIADPTCKPMLLMIGSSLIIDSKLCEIKGQLDEIWHKSSIPTRLSAEIINKTPYVAIYDRYSWFNVKPCLHFISNGDIWLPIMHRNCIMLSKETIPYIKNEDQPQDFGYIHNNATFTSASADFDIGEAAKIFTKNINQFEIVRECGYTCGKATKRQIKQLLRQSFQK